MARRPEHPRDLREACVDEALAIIDSHGIEALSLREVARRLGVSHQAPYKHYPSRDHLLAEVVRRAFVAFADHLDARPRGADAFADLHAMGHAYLDYATRHPLQYRLIFGTPLPDADAHPDMMTRGRYAFALLEQAIAALDQARPATARGADPRLDALHVWSLLHGLASIGQASALRSLSLPKTVMTAMHEHAMARMDAGLRAALVKAKPRRRRAK
ncbi:TetR/AcrR family transcriptional regulator [Falsiroseomonas sp. E2-1-a20]|uniref:TetR/AcrR family transcriptional regulator n=1 Tax=Falsiroseomonas sp. E2-1-a20 TaxID=3239300 RepID=UPI003F31E238